jgi:hypothetical protein
MQYQFQNQSADPIIVIIEPWAEEFSVPSNSVLLIDIDSTKTGLLETAMNSKYFTVWLWGGCRAKVSLDGEDRTPLSLAIPAFG